MTWDDVRAALARRVRVVRDEPGWMTISWQATADEAEVRQPIRVSMVDGAGETWLCFVAGVGEACHLDATAALAHNGNLLVGAVCWLAGCFVLRHVTPLATLDEATLGRAVDLVAHEAARLRHLPILHPPRRATPFVNFAE